MDDGVDRWIECDCPSTGVDFDITDETDVGGRPLPGPDDMVHCPHCGDEHRVGEIGQFLEMADGVDGIGGPGGLRRLTDDEWRVATTTR